jgi:hypothetical protein
MNFLFALQTEEQTVMMLISAFSIALVLNSHMMTIPVVRVKKSSIHLLLLEQITSRSQVTAQITVPIF